VSGWQPIERVVPERPIWVVKYDVFFAPDGNFCDAHHPEARKFTDCHGWYASEADALAVVRHFPRPNSYRVEKVHGRELIAPPESEA
jgi:hypothetical protein